MKLSILKPNKPDLFDRIPDLMDRVKLDPAEEVLLSPELQAMIDKKVAEEVAKIRLPEPAKALPTPPQIVRETRVEVVKEKADPRLDAALKEIAELKKKLEETDRVARSPIMVPGGSGVIGIPAPEAAPEGYVLTRNAQGKAEWKASTGGSGETGPTLEGFTVTNHNELLTLNESNVTLNQVARLLGTIITQLQA